MLKNMKMSKKEMDEYAKPMEMESPIYPHGLSLCLDEETIAKLGISEMPAVGQKLMIQAVAEVVAVEQQAMADEVEKKIRLQITDMEVDMGRKDVAKTLYGKS